MLFSRRAATVLFSKWRAHCSAVFAESGMAPQVRTASTLVCYGLSWQRCATSWVMQKAPRLSSRKDSSDF